ncbi:dual specificity protein phosphatase 22 isoform X1 [Galleria mellonella]|uniref:Dual specificity protein phosphatase 22 isoform X1 n=1 Tax=Galleria mellonella TaxID=7137 RepID=A0ABM3MU96_GALME|nr:dual specificity protein phosphatase 22 isoform X1 [Galleria mellonella]
MGNGMNKVLHGLYVGNYRDSKDPVQLEKYKITHILSIHDAARRLHADKHYLCIMASDSPDQNLTQYFSLCNDFIHAARLRDGNVLIHCLAGMSRSVTVAVAYIMSVTPLTWREALKVVRAGRAVANPNFGFQRQLQDFETYKLVEERRRLKERYPSLALTDRDLSECRIMLDSYQTMLSEKTICEGKCAMGRQCPTGVCRTGSKRQSRPRKPSIPVTATETVSGGGGLRRSPSTLSTTSTASGYRPRSSPAGLYSYTGAPSRPSRSASGLSVTRITDPVGGGTAMAVGGTEYSRRRAASAPATPALSPASSPPGSPHRAAHRGGCSWIIPTINWDPESM